MSFTPYPDDVPCREANSYGEFDAVDIASHRQARKACADCSFRNPCRDVAMDRANRVSGTFGGDLFKDGQMVASLEEL